MPRGTEVVFEAYPATRLVLRIMDDHFNSLTDSKRLQIFISMFGDQLNKYGFTGDNSPDRNTINYQWRTRDETPTKEAKWAPILKEREKMDGKELWAYIWLYDAVRKAAKQFEFGDPDEPMFKYYLRRYDTGVEEGFRLEVKVTDQV